MKPIVVALSLLLLTTSCKKETVKLPEASLPQMKYLNLSDTAIVFNRSASYDLDGDGAKDIYFSTLHVGDPLYQQDKKQWLVSSSFYVNLPANNSENIPRLSFSDSIPVNNFNGYNWYNASTIILSQKIIGNDNSIYWDGLWKDASRKYVPLQIIKASGLYNGWVEISFNKLEEKIILHQAAVSKEANKTVFAGK